ncbi:metallophosphoesterase family protein [Gemmata sp.]|uniref:metallophosphoesterase family protein n=1 Tax=Gemmata sp. TaxID=1914242 RepID=UPI003F6E520E
MWAVLSDIHANLEALDAVLDDVARHPVTRIICLGDVLGYGPNPIECLERSLAWDVKLLGNHDQAAMFDPDGFNLISERAIFWHRQVMEASGRNDLWDALAGFSPSHLEGDFLFVHGSPRNPLNEYVFPEDVYNARKMIRIGDEMNQYCFAGHTHVPGVFFMPPLLTAEERERYIQRASDDNVIEPLWQFRSPPEFGGVYRLDHRKTIVNVGSVGQPRDGDWRACYALVDGLTVTFRRVEYDVDVTVQKIYDTPELDDSLADQLREGR